MKKGNIEELFDMHREKMYQKTDELSSMTKEIESIYQKLKITLTQAEIQGLNEIMELENARGGILEKQVFVYAFSLATKLFAEGLSNDKNKEEQD